MNAVRPNNVSLKYQRFTSSGCKYLRITKIEFVAKTQFLQVSYFVKREIKDFLNEKKMDIFHNHIIDQIKA